MLQKLRTASNSSRIVLRFHNIANLSPLANVAAWRQREHRSSFVSDVVDCAREPVFARAPVDALKRSERGRID
jgi:hypothetical protein